MPHTPGARGSFGGVRIHYPDITAFAERCVAKTRQVILIASARVVLLDWDIQSLAHGNVVPWLQHMRERTMIWFRRLKPLRGLPKVYIEPADNGYAIIEAARAQGCKVADGRTTRDGRADEDRQIGARQAHDLNLLLLLIILRA